MMSSLKIEKVCNYLLYSFIFLIPWQTRYIYKFLTLNGEYFEYGKLSFYLSEFFLILFIFCSLFFVKKIKNFKKKDFKSNLVIFIFLLVILISFFGALNKQLYFYSLIKVLEVIVLYFLITRLKFNYLKLGISFIASMFIHSMLGIYQFFSQSIFANKYLGIAEQVSSQGGVSVLEGNFGRLLRAYGGFSHPNIFGGFLVIAILILISIYFYPVKSEFLFNKINKKEKEKGKTILFYLVLIILFSALILSFSRSAFLALFFSLFVLCIYSLSKKTEIKRTISILLILILVSIISSILFNDFLKTRIQGQERLELESNLERIILREQAFELLNKHWFLGVGINNYIIAVYNNDSSLDIWDYQPVHNVYLLILVELGILGLISYVYLLFYTLYKAFVSNDLDKIILGLVILTIIIINFFDHYFWTYWSGLIITFLAIALINKSPQLSGKCGDKK